MWTLLCIISAITSGFASVIMKICSRNNNSRAVSLTGLVTINISYIIISIIFTDVLYSFNLKSLIFVAPLTLCQMIGYICGILSVKYASVSTVIPIRNCNCVITLILGIIFLHESVPPIKLILSLALILLSILIVKEDKVKSDINGKKGIIFAWLFVIFNGTSSMLNKYYINIFVNPLILTFYYSLFGILIITIYLIFTKNYKYINPFKLKNPFILYGYIFLDLISNLSFRYSLVDGKVSIAQTIHASSIVITLISSYIILKESISKKKWCMIIIITILVLALSFKA